MKKNFELSPELFKTLLECDKESFIATFPKNYYLSASAISCIFPVLPDNDARKKFFLACELSEECFSKVLKSPVLDALNLYFPAFEFLLENQKYELIIKLGYSEGAEFLYEKGAKDFLIECSSQSKFIYPVALTFYNKKEWLLLEGALWKEIALMSLFEASGVLAVQEKNGKDIKKAMNIAYRGYEKYTGGKYDPAHIYEILNEDTSLIDYMCAAWYDWGKLPDPDALEVWWYKNVEDDQFRAKIVKIFKKIFKKDRKILAALQNPNFPTKLTEIEEALNS